MCGGSSKYTTFVYLDLTSIRAVSYTHLDVYKRQKHQKCILLLNAHFKLTNDILK